MIAADPEGFFQHHLRRIGLGAAEGRYPDAVTAVYRSQLDDPATVEGFCEDYRAGATIDCEHDAASGTITCPVMALWAARGALGAFYDDVLAVWRPWAPDLRGHVIDASHFLVEDEPEAVTGELLTFLGHG